MWLLWCVAGLQAAPGSQGLASRVARLVEASDQQARPGLIRALQRDGWQTVALQQARGAIPSTDRRATSLRVLIADAGASAIWWEVDRVLGALERVPRDLAPQIDWRRALAALERGEDPLVWLTPRVPRGRAAHLRGVVAVIEDDPERALAAFREAGASAESPAAARVALLDRARVRYGLGELVQARALLEQIDGAPLERAWIAFLQQDTERVLSALAPLAIERPAPADHPEDWAEGRVLAALALLDVCRVEEALARLDALEQDAGRQLTHTRALLGPADGGRDKEALRTLWSRLPPPSSPIAWARAAPGVTWILARERSLEAERSRAQALGAPLGPWLRARLAEEAAWLAAVGGLHLGASLSDASDALQEQLVQAEILRFELHVRPIAPSAPSLGRHCE